MCCFMWKDRGAYVWEDRERAYCFDFIRFLLWFLQEWAKNVGWKKMLNLVASRIVICFRIDRECEWVSERELTRTKRYHHEPSIHPVAAWYNVGCDSRSKNPYSFQTGFSVHESHLMPESDRYKRNTHQFHCECWLDGGAQCDFVSRSFCPTTRTLRNKKPVHYTHTHNRLFHSRTLFTNNLIFRSVYPFAVHTQSAHGKAVALSWRTTSRRERQRPNSAHLYSAHEQCTADRLQNGFNWTRVGITAFSVRNTIIQGRARAKWFVIVCQCVRTFVWQQLNHKISTYVLITENAIS